jgi:two-component system invasion response regulator UvrY
LKEETVLIRIIVVDKYSLIREGVKRIIDNTEEMHVVGEGSDVQGVIDIISANSPDIVVADTEPGGFHGTSGLHELRKHFPELRILELSGESEDKIGLEALKAGADGFLSKSEAGSELVRVIQTIVREGSYISARLAKLLAMELRGTRARLPHERLTGRELQVTCMLSEGMPIKQVANTLSISISSVNTYRTRIFEKLEIRTNAGLIRYAIENGIARARI